MSRGHAGGRRGPAARATVLLLVVLLTAASGAGLASVPAASAQGTGTTTSAQGTGTTTSGAQGSAANPGAATPGSAGTSTSSTVAPLTPAEQRRADELRKVVRDALERDGEGDGLGDLDTGSVGGVLWRLFLIAVAVVVVIVVIALVRRGPRARRRAAAAAVVEGDAAGELERQARRAEEAGEHRAAVVLWFRAGTRGLLERRRIRTAATSTAGQVARAAGDDRVAALAVAHDRAAYGPGPVDADASRGAREGWATVLREGPASADATTAGTAAPVGTSTTVGRDAGPETPTDASRGGGS